MNDQLTPIECDDRVGRLYRRGLKWQLCSDLRVANHSGLLAQVEALTDEQMRELNRLDPGLED